MEAWTLLVFSLFSPEHIHPWGAASLSIVNWVKPIHAPHSFQSPSTFQQSSIFVFVRYVPCAVSSPKNVYIFQWNRCREFLRNIKNVVIGHDVPRKNVQKYSRHHSSLPTHLDVIVLEGQTCSPLLLDDYCCVPPSCRVLAELDRCANVSSPLCTKTTSFAQSLFTWTSGAWCSCDSSASVTSQDAWKDFLAELMESRFVCRNFWMMFNVCPKGSKGPVKCSPNPRSWGFYH